MQIYLLQTDNMNSNVVTLKETKILGFVHDSSEYQ